MPFTRVHRGNGRLAETQDEQGDVKKGCRSHESLPGCKKSTFSGKLTGCERGGKLSLVIAGAKKRLEDRTSAVGPAVNRPGQLTEKLLDIFGVGKGDS